VGQTLIKDIRDESNKKGIRIVIETKREATPEVVLNQLYKMTDLQGYIYFNMLPLVNDGRQPKLLNLREILVEFVAHRKEVVTRRTGKDSKTLSRTKLA
jgi:DNA gyrase subunit A